MNLQALRVQSYKSIEDSGWVEIDDLTCFVGRNESGKTGFMRAVEKLNPSYRPGEYEPYEEYPRQDWPEFDEDDPDVVVSARLDLDPDDVEAVESAFRNGLLEESTATVHRDYGNDYEWEFTFDEAAAVGVVREQFDLDDDLSDALADATSLSDLDQETHQKLTDHLDAEPMAALANEIGETVLEARLPEFRYVGEHSIMDGEIDVEALLDRRENDELTVGDRVFLSLLTVADIELSELTDVDDWRPKAAELEAAAASVNEDVVEYWSQSGDIQIRIETRRTEDDRRLIEVRVENEAHNVSVEFEGRSLGFRQFFSTFCELSELQTRDDDIVLLLDEPGLNLHARAKQEFLSFLKEELAPKHPVVYTTHSPFMIDPKSVHRVVMVEDEPVGDENLFRDVAQADDYTRFPLRNVFELDLMETMLVRPQTLLVESAADHAFLFVAARLLETAGETGLDPRWTVVPIKDQANIHTFVSLFDGGSLDVAALLQEDPTAGRYTDVPAVLEEMEIALLPEYSGTDNGTVEDVFSEQFYLELVTESYAAELEVASGAADQLDPEELSTVSRDGPIVDRVQAYFEEHDINRGEFDRTVPARYFQRNREQFTDSLDNDTIRNFDRLFTDLNNTVDRFDDTASSGGFFGGLFG